MIYSFDAVPVEGARLAESGDSGILRWNASSPHITIEAVNKESARVPLDVQQVRSGTLNFTANTNENYVIRAENWLTERTFIPEGFRIATKEANVVVESLRVVGNDLNFKVEPQEFIVGKTPIAVSWEALPRAITYTLMVGGTPEPYTDAPVNPLLFQPEQSTEFQLIAQSPFWKEPEIRSELLKASALQPTPVIVNFSVPTTAFAGDNILTQWDVSGADTVIVAGAPQANSGPLEIPIPLGFSGNYPVTLRAIKDGMGVSENGVITQTRSVQISARPPTPAPVSITDFRAFPEGPLVRGSQDASNVELVWSVNGDAENIRIESDLLTLTNLPQIGRTLIGTVMESTIFQLIVSGRDGSEQQQVVVVTVDEPTPVPTSTPVPTATPVPTPVPPPMIINFAVSGDSVQFTASSDKSATYRVDIGAEVNLSWRVQNAQEITLNENLQPRFTNLAAEQVIPLRIIQETTYQLVARTDGADPDRDDRTIILAVNEPILPAPPTNLTVDEETKMVRWSYFSDQDLIIGFRIYRAELGSTQFDRVANESTLTATRRDWTDPDPQVCGKSYYAVAVYEDQRVDPSEANNKRETDPTAASYNTLPCQ